jgi:hypothetical protein
MLTADLHGPAAGDEEEVDERRVSERYLVGMLATRRQSYHAASQAFTESDEEEPQPDELTPEESDSLAQGGATSSDDGTPDTEIAAQPALFPSSFGMSFAVADTEKAILVHAKWGQYQRVRSETLKDGEGEPKRVWKRTPRGGFRMLVLVPGIIHDLEPPDENCPEVRFRGVIRRRENFWSVTLFLVNGQQEPASLRDSAWLFQSELFVTAYDEGKAVFVSRDLEPHTQAADPARAAEDARMTMLYRQTREFAAGHGVSVHADVAADDPTRAVRISTVSIPRFEVPMAVSPSPDAEPALAGLDLSMSAVASIPDGGFAVALSPLADAYEAWIDAREADLSSPDLLAHGEAGALSLTECRVALSRIRAGIAYLDETPVVAQAFRFANRSMRDQRVRTLELRARRTSQESPHAIPEPRWFPFQLAFILLSLRGIADLAGAERTTDPSAVADLLWFPTGGGKTEAYLGLAAFTMALRRLEGVRDGRDGRHGIGVLMRYTLRLLTVQQFQRAAALIAAQELIRREDPATWGDEPFRLGLWVGQKATPNTTEQAAEFVRSVRSSTGYGKPRGLGTPLQIGACPWCGAKLDAGRDITVESRARGRGRTIIACPDPSGECPFTPAQSDGEGIPIVVVDEEIYRLLPSMLIATVDKFAQMPWRGAVEMLYGQVQKVCSRHGFRSPEIEDEESHRPSGHLPAATSEPQQPLRPLDLIIQDELHLINGPLGSMVGLYETAVDALTTWTVGGRKVRPKLIASTATVRRARDQVHAAFLRQVSIFPPSGIDAADSFFARQVAVTESAPGRLYLGILAPGRRLKVALIRVYLALLAASETLYKDRGYGEAVDPWMTLVGYFNSLRELGGMRRLVDDDVAARLSKMASRGLARRRTPFVEELTSRKASAEIPSVLELLETPFDPSAGKKSRRPIDVLLATNMVQVGVDVPRLGLMVVAGQPKSTAEYIQATSRVGRSAPGLVVSVFNWARPRDLSHYEGFEHYHATFYKHVEAISVTPFAPGALSRGLSALLVSEIRLAGAEFNDNDGAGRLTRDHPYVTAAVENIVARALAVMDSNRVADAVRAEIESRLDLWLESINQTGGSHLGYDTARTGVTVPLLKRPGLSHWQEFTCLMSLRDVEPTVALLIAPRALDGPRPARPSTEEAN